MEKSSGPIKTEPELNPDEVVKAFMGKDDKEEDSEKGALRSAVGGAVKTVGSAAMNIATSTNSQK
jgi:hypothetical protein